MNRRLSGDASLNAPCAQEANPASGRTGWSMNPTARRHAGRAGGEGQPPRHAEENRSMCSTTAKSASSRPAACRRPDHAGRSLHRVRHQPRARPPDRGPRLREGPGRRPEGRRRPRKPSRTEPVSLPVSRPRFGVFCWRMAGAKLRKLPARRYGPRKPELTASRRPRLRGPRPSVQDGRWDKCGTGREGVEKIEGFFGAMHWGRLETMGEQPCSCDRPDVPAARTEPAIPCSDQDRGMPALTSRLHNPVSPSVSIFSGSPQCLQ
jgi:hypothetical protein